MSGICPRCCTHQQFASFCYVIFHYITPQFVCPNTHNVYFLAVCTFFFCQSVGEAALVQSTLNSLLEYFKASRWCKFQFPFTGDKEQTIMVFHTFTFIPGLSFHLKWVSCSSMYLDLFFFNPFWHPMSFSFNYIWHSILFLYPMPFEWNI